MRSASSRSIERAAAAWLARRDSGAWTPAAQSAFDAWLDASAAHRVAWLRLEAAWNETGRLKVLAAGSAHGDIPPRGQWARSPFFAAAAPGALDEAPVAAAPRRRNGRPRRWSRWRIAAGLAAMLVVAVVATLGWQRRHQVDRGAWSTALGALQVVHLADGSTATLGGDTTLRAALSRQQRNLYLTRGEAFFDVAHDRGRPFVVHADGYRVIAVGTRFDVLHDQDRLRVVVTRGLVRLQSTADPSRVSELPPGSIALVDAGGVAVQHVPLEQAHEYLSWREGYVVFRDTPLAEALDAFNRYNADRIVIADASLDALRVGGRFKLDNGSGFLRLVQQAFPIRAETHGGRTLLYRRPDRARRD